MNAYAEMTVTDKTVRYMSGFNDDGSAWQVFRMRLMTDGPHTETAGRVHWQMDAVVLGEPYEAGPGVFAEGVQLSEVKAKAICMILNAPEELDD